MTIDTLEYAKELQAAGVTAQQAEAHARALKKAVDAGLITKPDLEAAVQRLEGRIDIIKTEFAGKFTLPNWMVGFNLAATLTVLWKLLH
jgi:hypothetical protein